MNETAQRDPLPGYAAERPKAFVDAVVAIAMTLLILPLMESVSDAAGDGESAAHWLWEHRDQLISFLLSFAIIAMFWIGHHRLFEGVQRITNGLLWLLAAWMLSIVWLPVATAISGQMSSTDAVAKLVYIGSMIVASLMSFVIRLYLMRERALHRIPQRELRDGIADDLAMVVLFALALGLTLVFPPLGYYPMLIMFATHPTQLLLMRLQSARVTH